MVRRTFAYLLTGASAVAFAASVHAQNAAPPAAPAASQSGSDQSDQNAIIITGTKRPQVLIDVPQSVTVVTGQTLETQHANNFQDYLKLVPGLQLDQERPGQGRLI